MGVLDKIPKTIIGPSAWVAADMESNHNAWLRYLTDCEIIELESAVKHFLTLGKDIGEITKYDFPLNKFATYLENLRKKLINGNGVELIRGLPIENYSQKTAATIFCGIGAHLGSARSQNADGHILGHVRDIGANSKDPNTRIYQTSERQSFHTDSADVVGLLCIKDAYKGGDSLLVSAISIYNQMRKNSSDLLELLFDPIATDRRGEIPLGGKPFMEIPVFNWHKGFLTVFYQRQYISSAQRFDEAMRLTNAHIKALNVFDALANDPKLHFKMRLEPGDMQFVYNHSQLHDRTAFTNWPAPEKQRHLLRLWISVADDRLLPECFKQRYGSIEVGNRGGIITDKTSLHAPLD